MKINFNPNSPVFTAFKIWKIHPEKTEINVNFHIVLRICAFAYCMV